MSKSRTRIVLLGWYGSGNMGDEAVLEAIVDALRRRGRNDLHALSINPAKTSSRLGISSTPRTIFNLKTLRALRGAQALVLGGGGLIQDRTSVYNLPIYAFYALVARLLGLTVIGWGLGVEPLDTLLGKWLARSICAASAYFSVRDEGSKRLLVKAGVPRESITVGADPAFLIEPSVSASSSRTSSDRPTVYFCLRDLPDNRPGLNPHYLLPISVRRRIGMNTGGEAHRTAAFVHAIARGVALCVHEFGTDVVFLPLWPGRDSAMIDAVAQEAAQIGVDHSRMRIEVDIEGAAHMVAALGRADLLVSMRLHALIFASGQGVPLLALAYARKMRGMMRLLGAERWVVEVETRNPPPEEVEMKLRQLWQNRAAQGASVREAARKARQQAIHDADIIANLLSPDTPASNL